MKLKLKNIGVGVQDVRIIRLTEETSLNNSDGIFTAHDPNEIEFGVRLGEVPVISCDGASPIVGCVYVGPLNGSPRTSVYLNDKLLGIADEDNWFDDLFSDNATEEADIKAYYLQDWPAIILLPPQT